MPLDTASLQSALETLFAEPPTTAEACAQAWADAVEGYASDVVPASTSVSAASAALTGALTAAFGSETTAADFDAAFLAFATTLATGMGPDFAGVPPAAPLGVATLLAAAQPTHEAAAAAFSQHLDLWFKTGSATSVPPGVTLTWS